jgi:hypothetical protein
MNEMLFENLKIYNTHRGLAIQLRDQGDVFNVKFKNITATLHHEELAWWGASEAIYVTALPRFSEIKVGFVSNITFEDIKMRSENGIFIAGNAFPTPTTKDFLKRSKNALEEAQEVDPHVFNITISNVELVLRNTTSFPGGYQDYRPCLERDVVHSGSTAALWVEDAKNILLNDAHVQYLSPKRDDWNEVVHIDEDSVKNLVLKRCTFGEIPPFEEEEAKETVV